MQCPSDGVLIVYCIDSVLMVILGVAVVEDGRWQMADGRWHGWVCSIKGEKCLVARYEYELSTSRGE